MHQIRTSGVQESLNKVKDTATIVNGIMQGLSTPEMVKNIENFRLISENMNQASTKMQNTMQELKETGVIDEGAELIKSAKGKINSFGDGEGSINGQDLHDVTTATKEMMESIKELVIELTVTAASSKKSTTIRNVKETINEASDIYKTIVAQAS
jgi:hypothetical protein